jgi:hypothetical protein
MIEGIKKMEANVKDGMAYSSAIHLEDEEQKNDGDNCEESARNKARTSNNKCTRETRKKELWRE